MNTSNSAAAARRIGLIELPDLAGLLTQCGLQVVSGPDFRAAATAIIAESKIAGAFPIIVADVPAPGLRAWVGHLQQKTPVRVAVVRNPEAPVVVAESVAEITLPITVNDILAAVGAPALDGPEGLLSYPAAPAAEEPVGIDLPELDFFDDEPVAPVAPAPVIEERAAEEFTPQPAPASADDWDAPAPVVAPAPVAVPSPVTSWDAPVAAATDDWDTPALAAPAPAPAAASAPVDDEWDTPAPVAAPEPAGPAINWDAPAPVQAPAAASVPAADDWDTPVFTAPVQAPAPAMADIPVADEWDTPAPAAVPAAPRIEDTWGAPAPAAPQISRRDVRAALRQDVPPAVEEQAPVPAPAPVADWSAPVPHRVAPAEEFGDWDTPAQPAPAAPLSPSVPAEQYFTPGAAQEPLDFVKAPAGAPVWGNLPAQQAPAEDSSPIFDDFEASKLHGTGRSAAGLGSMVVNYSGKGGVGKSTTSLQLATVAAEAGLRVILIDGNSGQGDLRTYLRLNRTNLPTMYDAAIGNIRDAILTPATINANREENLGEIKFAFIGAPPDDINDPTVVTDALYRDVIHFARRNADLVILDTQIIESADRTGVVNTLILPALVHDAWGIGVTDMSTTGVNNLNNRLRKFINEGVPTSRLMITINQVHPEQMETAEKAVNYFRNLGTFIGAVGLDIKVKHDMNAGRINADNAQLRAVMSKALLRVTGNEAFRESAEYTHSDTRKPGIFGRLLGKKAS